MSKNYVYMRRPVELGEYMYGLKAGVVYKCQRCPTNPYLYASVHPRPDGEYANWMLEGFEQLSNVEVIALIYSGKVIPEDLP